MDEIESTAVTVVEPSPAALFGTTEPTEVIDRAGKVADALKSVIVRQKLTSNIQGKEYVRCEGWTLLGSMLGVYPVNVWTRETANGWEARVEARTRDGAVVGAAEAMCTKDEPRWKNADAYALRSMAQTRATSKALRMPLGFVMTLAGYEATPAEEMTFAEGGGDLERAVRPATQKQVNYIKSLLRDLFRDEGDEHGQAVVRNLANAYPHARTEDGKFAPSRLTAGEAGEVITELKGE